MLLVIGVGKALVFGEHREEMLMYIYVRVRGTVRTYWLATCMLFSFSIAAHTTGTRQFTSEVNYWVIYVELMSEAEEV